MKKLLLLLLCVPFIGMAQQTYVPDDNFEQALITYGYDNILDDYVQTSNINTVDSLHLGYHNISDLTGIEDFTALTYLSCPYNNLTILDLSSNTALTYLGCYYNNLTSLDVSQNTALTRLDCYHNNLTSLDVSGATALTILYCEWNQLTSLDVSGATALTILYCHHNNLTSLDVSGATALTILHCDNNQLTSLDVSNNTNLTDLDLQANQLTILNLSNQPLLETIGLKSNPQLKDLIISNNTVLVNFPQFATFQGCNSIENIVLDNMDALTSSDINNEPTLKSLIYTNNVNLAGIACHNNALNNLVINGCPNINYLECSNNQLSSLDISELNYFTLDLYTTSNPALMCIQVNDSLIATNALSSGIDGWTHFSEDCNYVSGIEEHTTNKELLKVTDIFGREVNEKRNTPLFYIYKDGTVEKKMIIE